MIGWVGLIFILVASSAFSDTLQQDTEKTIPFFIYKQPAAYVSKQSYSKNTEMILSSSYLVAVTKPFPETKPVIDEVSVEKLKQFIKKVKDNVCQAAGDSDIKVWISFDAETKILGIGTGAQSGLEVIFHCK